MSRFKDDKILQLIKLICRFSNFSGFAPFSQFFLYTLKFWSSYATDHGYIKCHANTFEYISC